MEKRLFRNEHDKVVAGISSGIAEFMEVDVTIIRLLFVLSTIFLVGTGILVYIIMWIVVPVNNDPAVKFSKFNDFFKDQNKPFQSSDPFGSSKSSTDSAGAFQNWTSSTVNSDPANAQTKMDDFKPYQKNNETGRTVAGLFLLVIGIYFFMDEFNLIPFHFQLIKLWPLIFVAIGASFIIKSKNKSDWENWKNQQAQNPVDLGQTDVYQGQKSTESIQTDVFQGRTSVNQEQDPTSNPIPPGQPETPEESNDPFTKKDI